MEFVEDDGPFRRPPAPDDRVWRHPSELGTIAASPRRLVPQRTVWVVAIIAALGASMLTTGLVVAVGGLDSDKTVERPAVASANPPATAVEPVVAIAERVRPAIALVKATVGSGATVSGSGVFFLADGHLLTNAHVIAGATSIRVVLASGRELTAGVVGSDPDTDAAVIKVDGGPFPVADLGSAANLKVGQTAVAIGSPLALAGGPSVTVGVVSALHRSVKATGTSSSLFDMIQTDAPINPGSSGGALLDGNGRVIGLTTAVAVSDGGADGLGFATPIDVARSVATQLMTTGKATHAWLGIDGNDLDGATAHDLNLQGGAVVSAVKAGGPADAGGLTSHDIILSFDGKPVQTMGGLVVALQAHQPGDTVTVELVRDNQRLTRTVTLAERPSDS